MAWLDAVDNYCERIDAFFFAEPLNALSNGAFLIAAWFLWREYQRRSLTDITALLMVGLVATVGIGSLLFHTFANILSMWADILPIMLFVFSYLWLALRRFLNLEAPLCIMLFAMFLSVHALLPLVPPGMRLNGSIAYLPSFAALLAIGAILREKRHEAAMPLIGSALLFALSLAFRSFDMSACKLVPIGTHFMWHLLNGLLLYRLTVLLLPKPRN